MVTRHSNVDAAAALPLSRTDVLYPMPYETLLGAPKPITHSTSQQKIAGCPTDWKVAACLGHTVRPNEPWVSLPVWLKRYQKTVLVLEYVQIADNGKNRIRIRYGNKLVTSHQNLSISFRPTLAICNSRYVTKGHFRYGVMKDEELQEHVTCRPNGGNTGFGQPRASSTSSSIYRRCSSIRRREGVAKLLQ